jgi:dephospho-CoA kinase
MKPFGLTGGMGCGKSEVAKSLSTRPHVKVVSCDNRAKIIVNSPQYRKEICAILGTDVYVNGIADSRSIAGIVFGDPQKKRALEEFVHPFLWESIRKTCDSLGQDDICVVESAILYEVGSEDKFAAIIVAACNPVEQYSRLREKRKMTDADIKARLNAQLSAEEKEKRADFVIHTDCSLEELDTRVENLYQNLKRFKGVSS